MTENYLLPPELERLEQQLAARPRWEPSNQLKEQFLHGLRAESRRGQARARRAFAVSVAASVLVWLNFSLSATQATDYGLQLDGRRQSAQRVAEEIRRLLPEVPPREAIRQAILLRGGAGAVPCLRLSAEKVARGRNEEWAKFLF